MTHSRSFHMLTALGLILAALMLVSTPLHSVMAFQATATPTATASTAEATPMVSSSGNAVLNAPTIASGSEVGFIRFLHASPDIGPLDIYQGDTDTPLVSNLQFGNFTDFLTINSGATTFVARPAGSATTGDTLSSLDWTIHSDTSWLLVAAGLKSNVAFQLEPLSVVRDQYQDDNAHVRVINMVSGSSLYSASTDGGVDLGQSLGFAKYADNEVPAGTYNVQVTNSDGANVTSLNSVEFAKNATYTLFIVGSGADNAGAEATMSAKATASANQPIQLLNVASPSYNTRVNIINNMTDAVDIMYRPNDTMFASNLAAGSQTDFIQVPSQAVTFLAFEPGTGPDGHQLASLPVQLHPGRDLTLTLTADGQIQQTDEVFTASR